MKKLSVLLCSLLLCCLTLAACNNGDNKAVKDFVADERHCVVALPQE